MAQKSTAISFTGEKEEVQQPSPHTLGRMTGEDYRRSPPPMKHDVVSALLGADPRVDFSFLHVGLLQWIHDEYQASRGEEAVPSVVDPAIEHFPKVVFNAQGEITLPEVQAVVERTTTDGHLPLLERDPVGVRKATTVPNPAEKLGARFADFWKVAAVNMKTKKRRRPSSDEEDEDEDEEEEDD
ncbi:hypothetical protein ADEAN_000817000 [Angomonas deanei]|uniref:Uncharacterized protein n=1 Tax=Angomonas deanei TaxID=59799 RepID=A0A7G2CLB4_9TRYP|nr:hypothetical protein ADEAN_000817000 [Angomonas deanei]